MQGSNRKPERKTLREALKGLWRDRKGRLVLVRYAVPVGLTLLLILLAALPLISFRTTAGESDAHSLFYWHFANFFGTDGSRGAYELFRAYDSGNTYYSFYRAVVVLFIIDAVAAVLGVLLTLAFSGTALYLLLSGERTDRSRFVGKLFRVIVGGRYAVLVPYLLTVLPFAFSKLFAYFSTTLRSYDTSAEFFLIDPLWIAIACFAVELVLLLRARDKERKSPFDLYTAPEKRVNAPSTESAEAKAWEAAVKADAARGIVIEGLGDVAPASAEPNVPSADVPSPPSQVEPEVPARSTEKGGADESEPVYGHRIVVGADEAPPTASEETTDLSTRSEEEEPTDETLSNMRDSIRSLFSEDEAPDKTKTRKKQK